ncbi:hypothetical protein KA082_01210 [Candidatus Woesebacteria bacterium]|nr:hypothetical protein [Candidatus Woesebacteria bacterium]
MPVSREVDPTIASIGEGIKNFPSIVSTPFIENDAKWAAEVKPGDAFKHPRNATLPSVAEQQVAPEAKPQQTPSDSDPDMMK